MLFEPERRVIFVSGNEAHGRSPRSAALAFCFILGDAKMKDKPRKGCVSYNPRINVFGASPFYIKVKRTEASNPKIARSNTDFFNEGQTLQGVRQ